VTLEPCVGPAAAPTRAGKRRPAAAPPCTGAVVGAGIARVVVAVEDPDPGVAGRGIAALRAAGIEVVVGAGAAAVERQLAPYLHQRRSGRPYVVLVVEASLDGRTVGGGAHRSITGGEAGEDRDAVRAGSDAVLIGAGPVGEGDPRLAVSGVVASDGDPPRQPLPVVLGPAGPGAATRPLLEVEGDLGEVLDDLGRRGIVQLMVDGGADVAGRFHRAGLVDRAVLYLAPVLMGGEGGQPVLSGVGAAGVDALAPLKLDRVVKLGDDLRVDLVPHDVARTEAG
jgi:diaminohydroxyphosphoribosylaminopyrimidine deaminase/5-amino-6-(5-phosphoribosylamino)uracil reductase